MFNKTKKNKLVKIGIDASSLRSGGSITHIIEILSKSNESNHLFKTIIIWANPELIKKLPKKKWIKYIAINFIKNGVKKLIWTFFTLDRELKQNKVDILFVPGAVFFGSFRPYVAMPRNLLPFDRELVKTYRFRLQYFRLKALRFIMMKTYLKSDGLILLSEIHKEIMLPKIKNYCGLIKVIPHGVNDVFSDYNLIENKFERSFKTKIIKISYVSIIDFYKNHISVVKAGKKLFDMGYKIQIEFVGDYYKPAFNKLQKEIKHLDPENKFIYYLGHLEHHKLPDYYRNIDIFIFSSSCEAYGQVLAEAMRSGLPIACSNKSALPGVLGDAGLYFDPDDVDSIVTILLSLINSTKLRSELSKKAYLRSKQLTWTNASRNTFEFILDTLKTF